MKDFDFQREVLRLLARAARSRGVTVQDLEDLEAMSTLFPSVEDQAAMTTLSALFTAMRSGPERCLSLLAFLDSYHLANPREPRPDGGLSFDVFAEVETLANRISGEPLGDVSTRDTLLASIILQLSVAANDGWLRPLAQAVAATAMKHLNDPLASHLFPTECLNASLN